MLNQSSREATPISAAPEESPRPAEPYVSEGEDTEGVDDFSDDMDDDDIA